MGLFDNDTLFAESYYYYQDANEQQSAPGARKRESMAKNLIFFFEILFYLQSPTIIIKMLMCSRLPQVLRWV